MDALLALDVPWTLHSSKLIVAMYQPRIQPRPPRHDRLFELIRQRNVARKTARTAEPEELDWSEAHSFMVEAGRSLAPRVKVESPLKIRL